MAHFNKFDKGQRGGGFDGGRKFRDRNDGSRQMYPATCSQCGKNCEVPFRPTGDRPVFCSHCFQSQGGGPKFAPKNFGGQNRGGGTPSTSGTSNPSVSGGMSKAQFDSVSAKLDKILLLLTTTQASHQAKGDASIDVAVKHKKEAPKKAKTAAKKNKAKKK